MSKADEILANQTPVEKLHSAIMDNDYEKIVEMVKSGVDINSRDNRTGNTPLHSAMWWADKDNGETIKLLVELGADLSICNNDGETPLAYAAYWFKNQIVKILIELGADIAAESPECQIVCAVLMNDVAKIRELVALGADVNSPTKQGMTLLDMATGCNCIDAIKTLAELGADVCGYNQHGYQPLFLAKHADAVRTLVELGADVNARSTKAETMVLFPVMSLVAEEGDVDLDAVKTFIELGADVNACNCDGITTLMLAVGGMAYGCNKNVN